MAIEYIDVANMAQHGYCFQNVAEASLFHPEIFKNEETIQALKQSLKILTDIVNRL